MAHPFHRGEWAGSLVSFSYGACSVVVSWQSSVLHVIWANDGGYDGACAQLMEDGVVAKKVDPLRYIDMESMITKVDQIYEAAVERGLLIRKEQGESTAGVVDKKKGEVAIGNKEKEQGDKREGEAAGCSEEKKGQGESAASREEKGGNNEGGEGNKD